MNAGTQNSNVEMGERSGFKVFPHGITDYIRNNRRIDGGWWISIVRHMHVLLCADGEFFPPRERAQIAFACDLCVKVHVNLKNPLHKNRIAEYQLEINALLQLIVEICKDSTPSGCQSIKYHWPRHWADTRRHLGCAAMEKSLERKLGETHKKMYQYTNKDAGSKEVNFLNSSINVMSFYYFSKFLNCYYKSVFFYTFSPFYSNLHLCNVLATSAVANGSS